jgi:hypothetical protein
VNHPHTFYANVQEVLQLSSLDQLVFNTMPYLILNKLLTNAAFLPHLVLKGTGCCLGIHVLALPIVLVSE